MSTMHTNSWFVVKGKYLALCMGITWWVVAYSFILAAFDSGNLWEYVGALFFLVCGLHYFLFFGRAIRGGKKDQVTKA